MKLARCILFALGVLATSAACGTAEAVEVVSYGVNGIDQFELYRNVLYWWKGGYCPDQTSFLFAFDTDGQYARFPIADCAVSLSSATIDESYAYYEDDGRIYRKSLVLDASAAGEELV